ncbi:MAG: hypothetical protein ABI612_04435 [Betaproteobacteria bacterium]
MAMGIALRTAILTVLLVPAVAVSQTGETVQWWKAGDKTTYTILVYGKTQELTETWTSATETSITGIQKIGGREVPLAVTLPYLEVARMCLSDGEECHFSPGIKSLDLPLEKGKRWSTTFNVESARFTAEVTEDYQVGKSEKVTVPAGAFDAVKIPFNGRFKGTNKKGERFSGKEDGTYWVAFIGGRPVTVKITYRNSFGARTNRELVSTSLN